MTSETLSVFQHGSLFLQLCDNPTLNNRILNIIDPLTMNLLYTLTLTTGTDLPSLDFQFLPTQSDSFSFIWQESLELVSYDITFEENSFNVKRVVIMQIPLQ